MTETAIAPVTPATALAASLEAESAPYRGVLSPLKLDAPQQEMEALATTAAVHDLGWIKRITVRGEDRFRWLNGMVTNNIKDLPDNTGTWNLILNAQGQIQGDITVWREGDDLEITLTADQYEKLTAYLERYIIMDDVELIPICDEPISDAGAETVLGLSGPQSIDVLQRIGIAAPSEPMTSMRAEWNGHDLRIRRTYGAIVPHFEICITAAGLPRLWTSLQTASATPIGTQTLEAFRIAEGIPAYGIEILERDIPQETSQTRALHFSKGCYLGQEIVERINSRGNVHRHLRQLELTGNLPAAGTALLSEDGANAGEIRSAAELPLSSGSRIFALAMLRGEVEIKKQPLKYETGTAQILDTAPQIEFRKN